MLSADSTEHSATKRPFAQDPLPALHGIFLLVLLLFSCISGCSSSSSSPEKTERQVTLGVLLPLTGQLSSRAASIQTGLEQGIAAANLDAELSGASLRLRHNITDTEGDPVRALSLLREMADQGIRIFIGPVSSAECAAVADYARANGLVLISPSSSEARLALEDSLLRMVPADTLQARATATLMHEEKKTLMIPLYRQDNWGEGLAGLQAEAFASLGGQHVSGVAYDPFSPDLEAAVAALHTRVGEALAHTGATEIAVVLNTFSEGTEILRRAAAFPELATLAWYGSDGLALDPLLLTDSTARDFARKVRLACPILSREDGVVPTPFVVLPDKSLREDLSAALGRVADSSAFAAWDAAWLLSLALRDLGENIEADTLIAAFRKAGETRLGLGGRLVLDENGDLKFGNYGFYTVAETGGLHKWKLFAAFQREETTPKFTYVTEPVFPGKNPPANKVTLTAILDLSGPYAETGKDCKAGIEDGLRRFNRYLAANGYSLQMDVEMLDSQGRPDKAQELLAAIPQDRPPVVIGPASSEEADAMRIMAANMGLVLVSPPSSASSLAIADDALYRFVPQDRNQGQAIARLMNEEGIRSVALLLRDDIWGRELAQAMEEELAALGLDIMGKVTFRKDAPGLDASMTQLAALTATHPEGSPGAVVMLAADETEALLRKAAAHTGLARFAWYGGDASALRTPLLEDAEARAFAEKVGFTCAIYAIKVGGHTFRPASIPWEAVSSAIQQRRGSMPSAYAHTAWDALWISGLTLLRTEWSQDAAILGPALTQTSAQFIGLSNFMALDAYGDRQFGDYGFYRVMPGKPPAGGWVLRATYHFHPGMLPWKITQP